jgi:hypothetical protein
MPLYRECRAVHPVRPNGLPRRWGTVPPSLHRFIVILSERSLKQKRREWIGVQRTLRPLRAFSVLPISGFVIDEQTGIPR